MTEMIEDARINNKPLHVFTTDLSKAFDVQLFVFAEKAKISIFDLGDKKSICIWI